MGHPGIIRISFNCIKKNKLFCLNTTDVIITRRSWCVEWFQASILVLPELWGTFISLKVTKWCFELNERWLHLQNSLPLSWLQISSMTQTFVGRWLSVCVICVSLPRFVADLRLLSEHCTFILLEGAGETAITTWEASQAWISEEQWKRKREPVCLTGRNKQQAGQHSQMEESKIVFYYKAKSSGSLHPCVVNTYTSNTGRVAAATAGCTSASCLAGRRWAAASGGPFCFYVRWSFPAAPPLKREENLSWAASEGQRTKSFWLMETSHLTPCSGARLLRAAETTASWSMRARALPMIRTRGCKQIVVLLTVAAVTNKRISHGWNK